MIAIIGLSKFRNNCEVHSRRGISSPARFKVRIADAGRPEICHTRSSKKDGRNISRTLLSRSPEISLLPYILVSYTLFLQNTFSTTVEGDVKSCSLPSVHVAR
ncbi:hypothetical protein CONLIGDRAFT_201649 [Coniochaeta ligniaria NRRL 30616]|uniref:Uncharacterized protein n=1 Tax=Coniochaeta ligniaria NRRL 30616 TaxID=1408157 RepID=A0A1J7JX02_9PEZI|nr:hypothetical protein CONLIGDRAFT_201649 [Coniochaeta ligniaria NRRL 30616]